MELLNTEIITKLLSTDGHDVSKIRIRTWEVDNTIIEPGNNYGSEITQLTVHYEKDGELCSQNYIYKLPYKTSMYETGGKMGIFKKELDMYSVVLPELRKLDKNLAPHCFHTGDKYTLILEDLSLSGYSQASRRDQLDLEHCVSVFSKLAKFHAFSVHLNKLNKLPVSVTVGDMFKKMSDTNKSEDWGDIWNPYLEKVGELHKSKYLRMLTSKKDTLYEDFLECVKPSENGFNCLNHGDFWSANMMFKHDKFGLVESVKFIDFQMVNWASPVIDILRFTITGMRFEVYEKYFDFLLDIYLETLNKILGHFHCEPYNKQDLRKDIKDRFIFTFLTVLSMLPIVLADPKHVDLKEVKLEEAFENVESSKKFFQQFAGQSYATEVITKWLKRFVEEGLLDEWP